MCLVSYLKAELKSPELCVVNRESWGTRRGRGIAETQKVNKVNQMMALGSEDAQFAFERAAC
jgi:hypothetical protein